MKRTNPPFCFAVFLGVRPLWHKISQPLVDKQTRVEHAPARVLCTGEESCAEQHRPYRREIPRLRNKIKQIAVWFSFEKNYLWQVDFPSTITSFSETMGPPGDSQLALHVCVCGVYGSPDYEADLIDICPLLWGGGVGI